jgi:hypothetical protein
MDYSVTIVMSSDPMSVSTPTTPQTSEVGVGVHLMPFGTAYSGPAPVQKYMKTASANTRNGSEVLTSHFRGRCIKGIPVTLPEHVAGVLISSNGQAPTRSSEALVAAGGFDSLTVWEHDVEPSTAPIDSIFDYIDVARAV